jgi:Flp pilus assembly protein CpaB
MRSRGLVVAIAVVLAVLAAVGVIVYTNSVKSGATSSGTTAVLVATQDIPANSQLDPLIDAGDFQTVNVPNDTLVANAVTQESELRGQTTSAPIFANEQIPTDRLANGTNNVLGISQGHVGIGISVGGPQSVNGYVQTNDNIVLYVTFPRGTPIVKKDLKQLLSPAQIQKFLAAIGAGNTSVLANAPVIVPNFDYTVPLVRSIKVVAIQNPTVDTSTGRSTSGDSTIVLDALPTDAQQIVFASSEDFSIWLGLLPPENKDGYSGQGTVGVPFAKIVGVGGA